jgi:hypothetical protein
VLHLQHPVLVLVFKQKLCLSLTKWLERLASFFFPSFNSSCLVSSSLNEVWLVLRFQRSALWFTSRPALELGFLCVVLLGAYFFASPPFSGAGQRSVSQLHAVSVLCWFADCFSILQHHLTLDVVHWLRRWYLWTAIGPISSSSLSPVHCQPFCLSSLCLLKVPMEISSLLLPSFFGGLQHPTPSVACSVSVPCLLFSFFWGGLGSHSVQGAMLVYPRSGCGNIT